MNTKSFNKINRKTLKSTVALAIIAGTFAALPAKTFASEAIVSPGNINAADDAFDKKFREGRDLIDREEWAKAAEKFGDLVAKYPDNKSTDAALYWLAFCYKKQKRFAETNGALDRLIKDFPASSWADDARVLKTEIAFSSGKIYLPNNGETYTAIGASPVAPVVDHPTVTALQKYFEAVPPANAATMSAMSAMSAAPPVKLDREDEIKIAAFQSLLAADPKRAIETMSEILTGNSKTSETLKREILRAVRSPRFSRTRSESYTFYTNSPVNKQYAAQLLEALSKSFGRETNVNIRKEIIYTIADLNDEQSTRYILQLYAAENDREIKKAIINSLGGSTNFNGFGAGFGAAYAALSGNFNRRVESDKLLEIVRSEKDPELKRLAFSNWQRTGNFAAGEQFADKLAALYDHETDEPLKQTIIQSLAGAKQNAAATRKLIDIARGDRSDKLKLEAIYALRTSRSPEALKFLEDLIK